MMSLKNKPHLNPFWISGFLNAEGCFHVSFTKTSHGLFVSPHPSFSVTQPRKSSEILEVLKNHFDCGTIRNSKKDHCKRYEVRSIADLVNKILPHFEKYPLVFRKEEDLKIFKEICLLIHKNHHKNREGLTFIIDQSFKLNFDGRHKSTKEKLLKLIAC